MNLRFLLGRYKYNSDASGIPPTPRDAIRPAGILPSRAPLPGQIADAQGCWDSWLARRGRGAAGEPPPPQARNRRVRSPSALNPPAAVRGWNRLPILLIKERHGRGKHTKCSPFAQSLPVLDTGDALKQAVLRRLLIEELTEPLRWSVSSAALAHQRIYPLQQYFLDGLSACPVRPIPFFLYLQGSNRNHGRLFQLLARENS